MSGAVPAALVQDGVARVRQLVRDRDVLRTAFDLAWRPVSRLGPAAIEAWAQATLALSAVNAGSACILSFWRAGQRVDGPLMAAVAAGGHAAASVCGHAGAQAALACLEALPTAIRLVGDQPEGLAAWWQGLTRLAQEARDLVRTVAPQTARLLASGDGRVFADFVAAGLKATVNDKARRTAFFALEDPLAVSLLRRHTGIGGFAASEPMLAGFVNGLWGGPYRLRAGPPGDAGLGRTTIDRGIAGGIALLPPVFADVPATQERALYRAAAAHAYAHLTVPVVRHELLQLKPLQMALVGLIEDARVEALAIRRFPGLRRLWGAFHAAGPADAGTAAGLMARLARALLDPDHADPDGFVQKGRALFAAASLDDPAVSRRIGGLLGNELGQMRLQFNARTYAVEPAYRDDNMHLWVLPDTPDDALSLTVEGARGRDRDDADQPGETQPGEGAPAPRARDAGVDRRGATLATYPEWDAAAGVERPDWTTLRDTVPRLRTPPQDAGGPDGLRAQVARLVRSSVVAQPARQGLRDDGERLDLDALVAAAVARRSGTPPDPRIFRDRAPTGRDLATLVILDVSQSTAAIGPGGPSVLDSQRMAVSVLAAAMAAAGDRFALRAFASAGRDDVRLTRLKDFDEPLSPVVAARLAGLSPGLSTRLGAALRHAGAELAPLPAARKLVLVLTDGEPSDIDIRDSRELVEDARRAVLALRMAGIDVFGLVMDPEDAGSGAAIFGRHNTMDVRRLEELPARLAGVYFRLAQR